MRTIELFCGTKSFSKVMEAHGHSTFTLDNDSSFDATWTGDIRNWKPAQHGIVCKEVDILWASPPCQGFSVAVIGRNWNHDGTPKTDSARLAIDLVKTTIRLIDELQPKYWFIENPRAMLRKMPFMVDFLNRTGGIRHEVSYCQYGDIRMKPTDIFTNALWWKPKTICKRGSPCHVAAPRGARTGTQGISGARDRGVIPPAIFEEILLHYEN